MLLNGVLYKNVNRFKVSYDASSRNTTTLFVLKSPYLCLLPPKNSRGSPMCLRANFGLLRVYARNQGQTEALYYIARKVQLHLLWFVLNFIFFRRLRHGRNLRLISNGTRQRNKTAKHRSVSFRLSTQLHYTKLLKFQVLKNATVSVIEIPSSDEHKRIILIPTWKTLGVITN